MTPSYFFTLFLCCAAFGTVIGAYCTTADYRVRHLPAHVFALAAVMPWPLWTRFPLSVGFFLRADAITAKLLSPNATL
jgi:hypothetical protein